MKIGYFVLPLVLMPFLGIYLVWQVQTSKKKASDERTFGAVPKFELTAGTGRSFDSKFLEGKIWVANFIFTECPGVCPVLNKEMQSLQQRFQKNNRFHSVSFSVDPATDTPRVLNEYSKRYRANPNRWHFLTGERKTLKELLMNGFSVVADGFDEFDTGMITHSNKMVLVDGWGRIRGYFDGTQAPEMKKLAKRVRKLLDERF